MIPRVSATAQGVGKGFPGREILYMMFNVTLESRAKESGVDPGAAGLYIHILQKGLQF